MKNDSNHGIASSLSRREEFFGTVLIAVILAVGTNLIASVLASATSSHRSDIMWTGIVCVVGPLVYLLIRLFRARSASYSMKAVFVVDPEENRLVRIPGYRFSQDLCRTIEAAFLENGALKSAWEEEPLVTCDRESQESAEPPGNEAQDSGTVASKKDEKQVSYFAVVRVDVPDTKTKKKSDILLGEAIEFVILDRLSTHLSGYFQNYPDTDEIVTEYTRQHVPSLLLQNRILSLLSAPLEDRALFLKCSLAKGSPSGEIESIFGSDGSMYSRFSLILPKGTQVSRPSPGVLRLENERLVLELTIQYEGFNTNLPMAFAEGFLGKPDHRLNTKLVKIEFAAKVKSQALLKSRGWKYYEWVDSFASDLQEYVSFEDFVEHIGWRIVSTNLQATRRLFHQRPTDGHRDAGKHV